jgi:hypothetical protein
LTLSWIQVLPLLLVPFLVGAGLLRALGIGFRTDRLAFAGWAWLTGSLASAGLTLAWLVADKPIDGRWLLPIAATLGVALLAVMLKRTVHEPRSMAPVAPMAPVAAATPLESLFFLAVVAGLGFAILMGGLAGNAEPLMMGDEANIWSGKAKVMYFADALDSDFVQRTNHVVLHADYPMLNPLMQVWLFAGVGDVVHVDCRLPIQMSVPALLLVLASGLRRLVRPGIAALLLVLFFGQEIVQETTRQATADVMLVLGLTVAVDAWLRWTDQAEQRPAVWWRLACCGLACAMWSKNEGFMLVLVLTITVTLARWTGPRERLLPRPLRETAWLALPAAVVATTMLFNARFGFANDFFDLELGHGMTFWQRAVDHLGERLGPVAVHFWGELANAGSSRLLVLMFLCLVLAHPVRLFPTRVAVLVLATIGAVAAYALVFVATPYNLHWHLVTAAQRTLFHVTPLAVLGLALASRIVFQPAASDEH